MNSQPSLIVRQKASHRTTREQNRTFVLQQLFSHSPTTRAEIARATGLTKATVGDMVRELMDEGLVAERGTREISRGKPPTLIAVNPQAHELVTLDLSGDVWSGSVVDLDRTVVATSTRPAEGRRGAPALDALHELVSRLLDEVSRPLLGIGLATPGVVTSTGVVIEAANLGWSGLELASKLSEKYGTPVHVINDSRAIALAEYSLGDHDTDNLFVVNLGLGVGAGIILDGRLYRGEGDAAGEIGHIAASERNNRVTLEALISVPALNNALADVVDGDDPIATAAARLDDPAVATVVSTAGHQLGATLANVVGVLDIPRIVVTGKPCLLAESLLPAAKAELDGRLLPAVASRIDLTCGTVPRAAEEGATLLVLNRELGVLAT